MVLNSHWRASRESFLDSWQNLFGDKCPLYQPPRWTITDLAQNRSVDLAAAGDIGLQAWVEYEEHAEGYLRAHVYVQDLTAQERGLLVSTTIALPFEQAIWWKDLQQKQHVSDQDVMVEKDRPIVAVCGPKAALGAALPPGCPRVFRFRQIGPLQFSIEFYLGLSPEMQAMPSEADAQFILMAVDPQWGLRDALRQYYNFYPAFFTRRAKKDGSWLFAGFHPVRVTADTVRCPDFFAYHEIGVMHELEWAAEWEEWAQRDKEVGIDAFRYIIPGQRELVYLERLPEEYEYVAVLEAAKDGDFQLPIGLTVEELKSVVRNSVIENQPNKQAIIPRNVFWGGNALTFVMNPDPNLGTESQGATLLAWAIDYIEKYPQFAGIYLDSLGQWFSFLNYRKDHIAKSQIPATCDEQGRIALHNKHSAYAFQVRLREALHAQGKLLFANGIHVDRPFNGFLTDLFGTEGGARARIKAPQMRMYAYQKPALFLCYEYESRRLVEEYVRSAALYGCFPTMGGEYYNTEGNYARDADIWRAWIPLIKVLSYAGWEPVIHARVDKVNCTMERFGPRDGVCFWTLYNPNREYQELTIEFDVLALYEALQWRHTDLLLCDAMSGEQLNQDSINADGRLVTKVGVAPGDVRVLQLCPRHSPTSHLTIQVTPQQPPTSIGKRRYQVVITLPCQEDNPEQLQTQKIRPTGLPGEPPLACTIQHGQGLLQLALPQGWQVIKYNTAEDQITCFIETCAAPHPGKYHVVAYWSAMKDPTGATKPLVNATTIAVDAKGDLVDWATTHLGAKVRASHNTANAHVVLEDNSECWQATLGEPSWLEVVLPAQLWLKDIVVEWAPVTAEVEIRLQAYNDGSFAGEDIDIGWINMGSMHFKPDNPPSPQWFPALGVKTNRIRLIALNSVCAAGTWGVKRIRIFES